MGSPYTKIIVTMNEDDMIALAALQAALIQKKRRSLTRVDVIREAFECLAKSLSVETQAKAS